MRALDKIMAAAQGEVRLAGTGDDDSENDPGAVAQALDSILDAACDACRDADVTTWPAEARQMHALLNAADAVVDDLLESLGVEDPDETGPGAQTADDGGDAGPGPESDYAMSALHSVEAIRLAAEGDAPAAAEKKHGFKPDPENNKVCAVCGKPAGAEQHKTAEGKPIMDAKGKEEMKATGTAVDRIISLAKG